VTHKRGGRSAGRRRSGSSGGAKPPKGGGLLIGMRGGMRKVAGVGHEKSAGPGAGGAGALGRVWTALTIAILVVALVLIARRFAGH
jgi:hypothetical protein